MKVIVLMSTYNGEKYLSQQLDSLISQTLTPYKIFIRDDGSNDKTINIIEEYQKKYPFIEYYEGKNKGPAKSFYELINNTEIADYYALCDQDDVWFSDKIATAVNKLATENNKKPLLYASRFTLTDENLNPINSKVSKLYGFSDFAHSLIYHSAPGCTFVFNEAARKKIIQYDVDNEYVLIHDALIHKIVTMFGKMILDEDSHIYYRQHQNNKIGMDSGTVKVFIKRVNNFLNGKMKNYRSNTAASLLNVYGKECSKENKELLNIVANYSHNKELKYRLMKEKCFKSHGINDLFFIILVALNYI